MITRHAFADLGGANHGWLNAKHHFSFANYYDPQKLSHGELMVINDDIIAPHTGFDTHSHRDMEIITYVRKGAITHKDNKREQGDGFYKLCEDLYGKNLTIELCYFLRDEHKFNSLDALILQLKADEKTARAYISANL